MRTRPALLAVALLTLLTSHARAADDIPMTRALAIAGVAGGGRTPLPHDALLLASLRAPLAPPAEGDTLTLADGSTRAWSAVTANDDGRFDPRAAAGGYLWWTVEADAPRIMLLEAAGHRFAIVNGEPRAGDPYANGILRIPVQLNAGANHILLAGGRAPIKAALTTPPADVFVESRDPTLPDRLETGGTNYAGIVITNATNQWRCDVRILGRLNAVEADPASGPRKLDRAWKPIEWDPSVPVPPIPPLASVKVPVRIGQPYSMHHFRSTDPEAAAPTLLVTVLYGPAREHEHWHRFELARRTVDQTHKRTFISGIDGSVQYYSVVPAAPAPESTERLGLILSLHGASVEASSQAAAYTAKDWAHIVCPTNRRPFGFDWEDWGRLDALEVLEREIHRLTPDPRRIHLTGHSMGGHGTWSIGSLFPGRFASVCPSAGWPEFWTYAGAADWPDPTPVQQMLRRAVNPSRTLEMLPNLAGAGVFILHGDADDNVPVGQARLMRERLASFHPRFSYEERPGAGHWWGNQCVDWAPMLEFMRASRLPEVRDLRRVSFITPSPAVSGRCHWIAVEAQQRPMEFSRIDAAIDPEQRRITVTTDNVLRFEVRPMPGGFVPRRAEPALLSGGDPVTVVVDGQTLESASWPSDNILRFERDAGGAWAVAGGVAEGRRTAQQSGPFRNAFTNRFTLVVGTTGTPEENAWMLARARYDAETFRYRGNGSPRILTDALATRETVGSSNIILYGHADANSAFGMYLSGDEVEVRRGRIRMGDRMVERDDAGCMVVRPPAEWGFALVGIIGGTGMTGLRATDHLPIFLSGTGFPDWTILGPEVWSEGAGGIIGAGFFGDDWSVDPADSAWRD